MADNVKYKATEEWLKKWYDIYNQTLFGGKLGECKLGIFTTGKGSQGGTLGHFRMLGGIYKLKVENHSRRLFEYDPYTGTKTYVTPSNFVAICNPCIELNGNYSGTEAVLKNTLVHEMCHYYVFMSGLYPKQAHGTEFRNIATLVNERSDGEFTIQRLATADEMTQYELDPEIQAKRDQRKANKLSNGYVVVGIVDEDVRLSLTTSWNVVTDIKNTNNSMSNYFTGYSNDTELLTYLTSHGYRKFFRTYRYWDIKKQTMIDEILKYQFTYLSGDHNTLQQALGKEEETEQQPEKETVDTNTHNGYTIIRDGDGYNILDNSNHKTFAKPVTKVWFDNGENLFYFIMGNKFKFKGQPGQWQKLDNIDESTEQRIKNIIREEIQKILEKHSFDINDDAFEITPDMNLSEFSPI